MYTVIPDEENPIVAALLTEDRIALAAFFAACPAVLAALFRMLKKLPPPPPSPPTASPWYAWLARVRLLLAIALLGCDVRLFLADALCAPPLLAAAGGLPESWRELLLLLLLVVVVVVELVFCS
jgi:hypothetical protein